MPETKYNFQLENQVKNKNKKQNTKKILGTDKQRISDCKFANIVLFVFDVSSLSSYENISKKVTINLKI